MTHVRSALLVLAIAALSALGVRAGEATTEADFAKTLEGMLPDMGSEDVKKQSGPQQQLQKLAYNASRPGAEAERAALSKAMAAKLGADVPVPARVWIIRQLEAIGRGEAVDALAASLKDKDELVRETARRALQNNPAPEASGVLQKALDGADPKWRVAVINALGGRKDPANVPALLKDAASDDDSVRSAAVAALALAADKSAADVIAAAMTKGSDAAKRAATDAYLLLADQLAQKGDKETSLAIARKFLTAQGHIKCAAIVALGRAGGAAELATILDAMNDQDPKVRGAGVEALNLMTSKEATQAIMDKVKTASVELKVTLLRALANRNDKMTLPTFVAAADDADENVKIEGLKGLANVGDASTIPLLIKAAVSGGKVQEAARNSLDRLAGPDVDKAMVAAIGGADAKGKAELARSLGARRAEGAVPALLKCAEDADGAVRQEAWKALGTLADPKALPELVALLVKAQDADREEASTTVITVCKRNTEVETRAEPILAALGGAQGPAKLALLGVLGRVGGKNSLEALRAGLKDKDEKVVDASLRAMAKSWPDAACLDDLLNMAKTAATDVHKIVALQGYVRVAGLPSGRSAADTLKLYQAAMEVAKRPEERKSVLAGLGDVKSAAALEIVAGCLADEAVKGEAEAAAVKIAKEIWQQQMAAVEPVMTKVVEGTKNNNVKKDARDVLNQIAKKKKK